MLVPDPTTEGVQEAAVLGGPAMGRQADGERLVAFLAEPRGRTSCRERAIGRPQGRTGSKGTQRERLLPPPSQSEREDLLRRWQRAGD